MTSTRRVGLLAATGIGAGSMLGAGVFSGMWADVMGAGRWYLLALAIAGIVAAANAMSTAQLAARYPVAGGAYAYGRAEIGAFAGRVAGAAFVIGKTASVAVGALVLGVAVLPGHSAVIATAAIALCWALNARGITRTAVGATVIAIVVSVVLVALIVLGALVTDPAVPASRGGGMADARGSVGAVLTGASAAFFAFAGYARIATLGEEVRAPERTIPRAIGMALAWVMAIYVALAVVLRRVLGTARGSADPGEGTASASIFAHAPVQALAEAIGVPVWPAVVAAALAVGGAMLAVMAGAGRTAMAMAREGDLPPLFAAQGAGGAPWRAEGVIAVGAVVLVWAPGLDVLLVSVATILTYYAVANVAAVRQRRAARTASLRVPPWIPIVGLCGSLVLGGVALSATAQSPWPGLVVAAVVLGWPAALAVRDRTHG